VAFLHHDAAAGGLRVHSVDDGRTEAAGLDGRGLAGELSGEVKSVAGGVVERLENVLELLGVPLLLLLLLDPLVNLELITIDGLEERLGVKTAGHGDVALFTLLALGFNGGLGGCVIIYKYK